MENNTLTSDKIIQSIESSFDALDSDITIVIESGNQRIDIKSNQVMVAFATEPKMSMYIPTWVLRTAVEDYVEKNFPSNQSITSS